MKVRTVISRLTNHHIGQLVATRRNYSSSTESGAARGSADGAPDEGADAWQVETHTGYVSASPPGTPTPPSPDLQRYLADVEQRHRAEYEARRQQRIAERERWEATRRADRDREIAAYKAQREREMQERCAKARVTWARNWDGPDSLHEGAYGTREHVYVPASDCNAIYAFFEHNKTNPKFLGGRYMWPKHRGTGLNGEPCIQVLRADYRTAVTALRPALFGDDGACTV